jgi:hypothetical protein
MSDEPAAQWCIHKLTLDETGELLEKYIDMSRSQMASGAPFTAPSRSRGIS